MNPSLVRVVLVRTRNPLNIGAVARAMSNFGFAHLRVVNPYDLAFREARSAVGAADVLATAEQYDSVPAAVADCGLVVGTTAGQRRELQHPLRPLEEAAQLIRQQSCRVALLFGSEKRGLSNEDLSYCHWLLRIPTRETSPSMNLGQAAAVCLYELARESDSVLKPQKTEPARAADLHLIASLLADILRDSGYRKADALQTGEEKLRRLMYRLGLQRSDATLLMGMLRHIKRRLKNAGA